MQLAMVTQTIETRKSTEELQHRLSATSADLPQGFKYVVGVAIFRKAPDSTSWQVLVVKRSPTDDAFPNVWEIPGGKVDPGEEVRLTVERETLEETALVVKDVLGELEEMHWESGSGKKSIQFNFAVTVENGTGIRLSAEEHTEWKWLGEEDVKDLGCTPKMAVVLLDAFRFSQQHLSV